MNKTNLLLVLLFLLLAIVSCNSKQNKADPKGDRELFHKMYQSLPDLKPLDKEKIHTLRVLYVEDADLPKLSEDDKKELLKEVVTLCRGILGYKIRFKGVGSEDIHSFFQRMKPDFEKPEFRYPVLNWPIPIHDTDRIASTIERQVKKHDKATLIRYFGKPDDRDTMSQHVYKQFIRRLKGIYEEKDLKGKALSNGRFEQMSYAHWSVIAYNLKKADFIITNTLIAGADTDMPIYVINRGGVTSAFVENNLYNPYQAAGIFATYQYLSNGPYFSKMRGSLPKPLLIKVMAYLFVHELGHFLGRYKEYYKLKGSIHVAPTDLNYRRWYQAIDPRIHPMNPSKLQTLKKY